MKTIRYFGWASAVIAALLILLSVIYHITHWKTFCGVPSTVQGMMHAANTFLFMALVLFIGTKHCCHEKCENKDEK